MSNFFEHQKSSFKRNYLKNLIALASADGCLKEEEVSLITRIGLRRGLKGWQIQQLFEDRTEHVLFLPESVANRMNMLYDIMELVYVDRLANKNELSFIENLLTEFRLDAGIMDQLLDLFQNGAPSALDWRDFVDSVCCITVEA
jgi:uncharacterized tellurite resistance protein B-like protein